MARVKLSGVMQKHGKVVAYLLVSGVLGQILALLAGKPELVTVFAPAINYILYVLKNEIEGEGVIKALKK